jgi:hypothetical protein
MKNKLNFLGIIAMVAVIGLTMAACFDMSESEEGTAEITIKNETAAAITVNIITGRPTDYSVDIVSGFGEKQIAANGQEKWTFKIKSYGNNDNSAGIEITIGDYSATWISVNIGSAYTYTWDGKELDDIRNK